MDVVPDPLTDPALTGLPTATWRALAPTRSADRDGTPLALGVQLRRLVRGRSSWMPRETEPARPASVRGGLEGLSVGLRPLRRSSSTGGWIKGDVSWDVLRRPGGGFDPQQARWFAELHSIARELRTVTPFAASEWLTLDSVDSPLVWQHLARAEALGVPLVAPGRNDSVVLARTAAASLTMAAAGAGLVLRPRIEIDDEEIDPVRVRPVGHHGIYAFAAEAGGIALTLAELPLSESVRTALEVRAPITVPPSDIEEFLREAYPRIARHDAITPLGDVELPPLPPARLVAGVVFRRGDEIAWTLDWDYPGIGRFPFDAPPAGERDSVWEGEIVERVSAAWRDASDIVLDGSGVVRDADAAEFATRLLPALEAIDGVEVIVSGRPKAYHELTAEPAIAVSTVESTDPDWFELGVVVTIDGHRIPFTPLFTALALRRKKMLLSDGHWFSLAHASLDRLRELIDEAADIDEWEAGPRISRYQSALWADFEDLADESRPALAWRAVAEGLRDVERIEPTPAPASLTATLRPYQRAGFDWLAFLWRHRLGGILADDMGLGKTLQILAMIAHARETGETRPFLVVAPTSVLSTWRTEAARFVPELAVELVEATRAKRGRTVADAAATAAVVVTSYTLLRLDEREFTGSEWAGVILDEAQFVKNPQTKQHRAALALRADVRIAVTGTPLENSLGDLWALLSLTAPGLFASARRFREEYIGPIERGKVPENAEGGPYRAARLALLRRRIRPLVVRRTKEDVAPDLPPKQEQVLGLELAPAHRELYDTVLQRERQKVLGLLDDLDRTRFIVFRSLTLLRMLSLAPQLVDPAHAHIPSSKLDALFAQLTEIAAEGHRALVFSQFTSFLDLAAARLESAGIPYAHLDGSTRRRQQVVDAFRSGDAPVFLISLKAGGFGLTLTEADYVFLLDPWWNPAAEAQAVDRTHRIGQERTVMVYRMVAAGTIEEKVMALQRRKARLFTAVMDDDALFGQALTAEDIRGLLDG
jgi:superfamily II DNA or RNA helicase